MFSTIAFLALVVVLTRSESTLHHKITDSPCIRYKGTTENSGYSCIYEHEVEYYVRDLTSEPTCIDMCNLGALANGCLHIECAHLSQNHRLASWQSLTRRLIQSIGLTGVQPMFKGVRRTSVGKHVVSHCGLTRQEYRLVTDYIHKRIVDDGRGIHADVLSLMDNAVHATQASMQPIRDKVDALRMAMLKPLESDATKHGQVECVLNNMAVASEQGSSDLTRYPLHAVQGDH